MNPRSSPRLMLPAIGIAAVLTGCSASAGQSAPTAPAASASAAAPEAAVDIATGLALPWSIVFVG